MEAADQVFLMEVIGLGVQVSTMQIQTLIHLTQPVQIRIVVIAVLTVHIHRIIKVLILLTVFETIVTVIAAVVMQVLQSLLKHWVILTLPRITPKCTIKTVADILREGICIEMVAFIETGHCQDHRAL